MNDCSRIDFIFTRQKRAIFKSREFQLFSFYNLNRLVVFRWFELNPTVLFDCCRVIESISRHFNKYHGINMYYTACNMSVTQFFTKTLVSEKALSWCASKDWRKTKFQRPKVYFECEKYLTWICNVLKTLRVKNVSLDSVYKRYRSWISWITLICWFEKRYFHPKTKPESSRVYYSFIKGIDWLSVILFAI